MEPVGKKTGKKVVIVGGVAGGASCAARLRRLDENAEILMVERGTYVSFANCGLPYYCGGVIEKESSLLVADEKLFREQFSIDVRTLCEVVGISAAQKTVQLKNVKTGEVSTESYDVLVLSPGAAPVRPDLPGIDLPGVFRVRYVPDAREIRAWIEQYKEEQAGMNSYTGYQVVKRPMRGVVIGGGFIGIEMAENLMHQGLEVTIVHKHEQLLPRLDPEMSRFVDRYLQKNGVRLALNDGAAGFQKSPDGSLQVLTRSGKAYPADIVILAIGVRPETALAKMAGITIGERGGILVDEQMRTSNPDIFAVGDAVEIKDFVTGESSLIPLAGPANREGRIAADVISGRDSRFRGSQGTSIIGVFDGAVAWTGISENQLIRLGQKDYEKIYIFPNAHAGYYPDAKMVAMKVIFRKSDGRILGAQALGLEGVDKRIDVIAMAIQMGLTVYDLEESELCYAPQFGMAKSAINFAGMVAADVLRGDMPLRHWNSGEDGFLLDVRHPEEIAVENVPGACNIPLDELRMRLGELPKDRDILVFCRSGQRAYYATRILLQNGFKAKNISGGMLARSVLMKEKIVPGSLD